MKVTFLSPAGWDDFFFGPMLRIMEGTAQRLNIELEILTCGRDPESFREKGAELCSRADRPEYLLLVNENEVGTTLLPRAARQGIRTLTLSQGFSSADSFALGRPREKHASWLGELLPDDRRAGSRLAEILLQAARDRNLQTDDGRIHMIGVSGPFTIASILRLNGLRSTIAQNPDVVLEELAPAGWDEDRAYAVVRDMLERYPETSVVWAANDAMALGASRAIRERGSAHGRDVLVGGVDWAAFVPEMIHRGELTVSMGGHFFDGAWALVLLYDYAHGRDLPRVDLRSRLTPMTAENVERYEKLLEPETLRDLDLSRFSRVLHPQVGDFEISADILV